MATRISKLPIHWLCSKAHKEFFTTACGLSLGKHSLRHAADASKANCKNCCGTRVYKYAVTRDEKWLTKNQAWLRRQDAT